MAVAAVVDLLGVDAGDHRVPANLRPGPDPGGRIAHEEWRRHPHPCAVHLADHVVLGPVQRSVTPARRHVRRIGRIRGIQRGELLVADQQPPRWVGEAHLPVGVVRGQESDVGARRDGLLRRVVHAGGPVLAVALEEQQATPGYQTRIRVEVRIRHVRDVVSLRLGEGDEVAILVQQIAGAAVALVGSIERHRERVPLRPFRARVLVEAGAAPVVVRLVGVRRDGVEDHGGGRRFADHEGRVGLPERGRDLHQIHSGERLRRHLDRKRRGPAGRDRTRRGVQLCGRPERDGDRPALRELPPERAAVVPQPPELPGSGGCRGGAGMDVDGFSGKRAGPVRVCGDLRRVHLEPPIPATGKLVLGSGRGVPQGQPSVLRRRSCVGRIAAGRLSAR